MIALGSYALLRPWWLLAFPFLAALSLMTRQIHASLGDWARAVDAPLLAAMLERRGGRAGTPQDHAIISAIALMALALSGPALKGANTNQFRNLDATLIVMDVSNAASSGARLQQAVAAAQLILAQGGARQWGTHSLCGRRLSREPSDQRRIGAWRVAFRCRRSHRAGRRRAAGSRAPPRPPHIA